MNILIAQSKAELLRTVRNKFFIIFSLAMPVVFYFIFSSVVGDDKEIAGTEWKAYYLMSMTVFSVMGAAVGNLGIRLAQEKSQGLAKQLRVTPLPSWVYLSSKMVSQSLVNLGIIVILFLLGFFVKGINLSVGQWLMCGLWIWIGALPFLALGLLVGSSKSPETAQVLANIIQLGMAIMGGLWMPMEILPKVIQNIGEWLPTYRYGSGAWNILAGNTPAWNDITILLVYLVVFMLLSVYMTMRRDEI